RLAVSSDRVDAPEGAGPDRRAAPPATAPGTGADDARRDHARQRGVDSGFQGRVPHRRSSLLLSIDDPRWLESIRPPVRCAARAHARADAAARRTRLCRIWVAGAAAQ